MVSIAPSLSISQKPWTLACCYCLDIACNMEAKSRSRAGLLRGLFESSENLQKSSLASSRTATTSMLYD